MDFAFFKKNQSENSPLPLFFSLAATGADRDEAAHGEEDGE